MGETVVLLHGFGGTRRAWDGVATLLSPERYRPLALDLPGHGSAATTPLPITFAGCVEHALARSPERFVLGGYSLGGRVALGVALAAPERVQRLVLISTTAGIEDDAERTRRSRADHELADRLESEPYEQFIEAWRSQPLFVDEPPAAGQLAREDQRRNDPLALAAVLRGVGTGEMPSLWGRLAELEMPVTVLVGARDDKYVALGRRMAGLLSSAKFVVAPGGHGLLLENPPAIAESLSEL